MDARASFVRGIGAAVLVGLLMSSLAPRGALGTYGQEAVADPVPVVVIIFDELPLVTLLSADGRIDRRLFPNFAKLAEGSAWFRNAITAAPFSAQAVPSLLTGRYPRRSLLQIETGGASLFSLLDPSHMVRTPDAFPGLCKPNICPAFARSLEGAPPVFKRFTEGPRGVSLRPFLTMLGGRGPCLCVYHPIFPHSPWRYLPSGQRYSGTNPIPGQVELEGPGRAWGDDEWLVTQAYQRHILQAAFADRILGAVLERMRELESLDETLLVVTADHGVGFTPGAPKRDVTAFTAGQIAHVPLFLKLPKQRSGVLSDVPSELVDVAPSVMDILGVEDPATRFDGESLFDVDSIEPRYRAVKGTRIRAGGEWQTALKQKFQVFPERGESLELYGIAPPGTEHLLGAPVGTLPTSSLSVEVRDSDAYVDPDPGAADLPALVQGRLTGAKDGAPREIGVVVGGHIVAITRAYETSEGLSFYAMLPPRAFRQPAFDLGFVAITPEGLAHLPTGGDAPASIGD